MHKFIDWLLMGIFGTIAGCAIFVAFMGLTSVAVEGINQIPVKPLFPYHVGACLTPKQEPELWEITMYWRIEMVGKHAYLIRSTPANLYRDSVGFTLPFSQAHAWKEVSCPKPISSSKQSATSARG